MSRASDGRPPRAKAGSGGDAGSAKGSSLRAERALIATCFVLALGAWLLPAVPLAVGYHDFADQRTLFGVPNALDVLGNAAFAAMGLWGLAALRRLRRAAPTSLDSATQALAALLCVGLCASAASSAWYHLAPGDAGLLIDRLGMGPAFAAALGLAAATRVSPRAGVALAGAVLLAAPLTASIAAVAGNLTPWAVLQGGAVLLLAALAFRPTRAGALHFSIGAVVACYALAKVLEVGDAPVFAATHGAFSGHSAKHVVAAMAAWPMLGALWRAAKAPESGAPPDRL